MGSNRNFKLVGNEYFFAFLAIIFWGTVATAFKISLSFISVYQLLAISTLSSFLILLIILTIQRKINLFIKQSQKDWIRSALLGFINPFLYYIILFNAYFRLPAQEAMILNYSWPLVLTFLSAIFLKQTIKLKSIIALFISFLGIVVISTKGNLLELHFANPMGVVLALGSAFVWSIFWILNLQDKREAVIKLASFFLFGTIFSNILNLYIGYYHLFVIQGVFSSIYVGLFEMGITFVLWLKALIIAQRADKISQLIYITPFLSLLIISLILKEAIQISSFLGLILIISGIIINFHSKKE